MKVKYTGATAERGRRRKRFYSLTNSDRNALEEAKMIREDFWKSIPEVAWNNISK